MDEFLQAFERHVESVEKWSKEISLKLEEQNKSLAVIDKRLKKIMEVQK